MTPTARALRFLTLPGWQGSGLAHWQSRWEAQHGDIRVEQDDWIWPRRGDWMARLEEVLLADDTPAVLVAHSLGCHLVDAWAAHSAHTDRVKAALLVAPPDLAREDLPPQVFGWRPATRRRLPFRSLLVFSSDDPYCSADNALAMARDWGSATRDAGAHGHLNAESALGDWPDGRGLLMRLARPGV